jgi:hypothetical protein
MEGEMAKDNSKTNFEERTLSRRRFLHYAAGAAGAALALPRRGLALAQAGGIASADTEVGTIILDGLMFTYFNFPPSVVSSKFTFGKNFSATFTLKLPQAPGVELVARVPIKDEVPTVPVSAFSQYASSKVKNGIVLRSDFNRFVHGEKIGESFGTGGPNPTHFFVLIRPELRFTGNPDQLGFRLVFSDPSVSNPTSISILPVTALTTIAGIDPETVASLSSQVVTDPMALVLPRFELGQPTTRVFNGTQEDLTFDLSSRLLRGHPAETTVSAKIIRQTGFSSTLLQEAFAPGNSVEITYSSVQEFPSPSLMDLQTTLASGQVYVDRLFKTFVIA